MNSPTGPGRMPGAMTAVACIGLLAMVTGIGFGAINGHLVQEFAAMMDMPWGMVTVIDLYVGLGLVAAWVWWRERNALVAIAWSVSLVFGGNIVTCLYVLLAMRRSGGDAAAFWHGDRVSARCTPGAAMPQRAGIAAGEGAAD